MVVFGKPIHLIAKNQITMLNAHDPQSDRIMWYGHGDLLKIRIKKITPRT